MTGRSKSLLDFDGEPIKLVTDAFTHSESLMNAVSGQAEEDYLAWEAWIDMTKRNPDLPNISLPKIYSIVERKAAQEGKILFGRRPVIPWEARREEFKEVADIQTEILDELLTRAGFGAEGPMLLKMKQLYGTAYMNALPYFEKVNEKSLNLETGQIESRESFRLRLMLESWAPWEVFVDPNATGLEKPWQCRYVIKIQLASKRQIKDLFKKQAYPGLDIEELDAHAGSSTRYKSEHRGNAMLSRFGIPTPVDDGDTGVLLRYESPERYIDLWNGEIVLRDIDNPFQHKMINLSRMIHTSVPHTQAKFFGRGEAKPNQIQAEMLNDIWNQTFAAYGMMTQPTIFYRKSAFDSPDDIVFGYGQRIPISSTDPGPITNDILVNAGQNLPVTHFQMAEAIERNIDLTASDFPVSRGEGAQSGSDTATEVTLLKESGDARVEMGVRSVEQLFLQDFGLKVASIIDQSANHDDYVEIVGEEKALKLISASPEDLPGGHNFTFKGSDRVINQLVKQRNLRELAELLLQLPNAKQGGIGEKLLDLHDFDKSEQKQMLFTDDEMAEIRKMQLLLQAQGAVTGAQVTNAQAAQPVNGSDGNGQKPVKDKAAPNEAQESQRQTNRVTALQPGGTVQ